MSNVEYPSEAWKREEFSKLEIIMHFSKKVWDIHFILEQIEERIIKWNCSMGLPNNLVSLSCTRFFPNRRFLSQENSDLVF